MNEVTGLLWNTSIILKKLFRNTPKHAMTMLKEKQYNPARIKTFLMHSLFSFHFIPIASIKKKLLGSLRGISHGSKTRNY